MRTVQRRDTRSYITLTLVAIVLTTFLIMSPIHMLLPVALSVGALYYI